MKKSTTSLLTIAIVVSSFSENTHFKNLTSSSSKAIDHSSSITLLLTNTSSVAGSTDDFSDLEKQKMEWTSTFERLQKKWDQIPFEEYEAKKKEYTEFYAKFSTAYKDNRKKDHSDAYTQKLITEIDGFYSDKVSVVQMDAIKKTASKSFDEKNWSVYPSDRLNDIENAKKQVNATRVYLKQPDAELEAYEQTLTDQKAKIIKYVSEGGLEKRDAEIEKRMVEKRVLHQPGMSDASVNSIVNSKIDKTKYGTPQKVVITSNVWEIERNKFGHPLLKFVYLDIATKKDDGKCYYVKGAVAQKYEGGGVYGEKYFVIHYTEGEMNCNNVK